MAIGRRAARTAEACSTHDGLVPDMDLGSGLRHGHAVEARVTPRGRPPCPGSHHGLRRH
jgi:hypothetical protein